MKKVVVLNQSAGIKFGFGERDVVVSDTMAVADAEHIQALYPKVYVEVVEVADEPAGAAAKAEKASK
ncbi:hypothetical protein GO730_05880 [Spirosoma sp. HMF3257]|uniref:Uncharacterized protein n=1 Tax=Spirosoma telluris TaxID=2183553 RepID=A0A327NGQ4_9BACT|nr:hypothetical protein [Spirosoma telluris]RAI74005.1 hypothetical protein HMF3257_05835 [Spirosoma telluris]